MTSYIDASRSRMLMPRPVRGVALRIEVDHEGAVAELGQAGAEVDGRGGLADAALLVGDGDHPRERPLGAGRLPLGDEVLDRRQIGGHVDRVLRRALLHRRCRSQWTLGFVGRTMPQRVDLGFIGRNRCLSDDVRLGSDVRDSEPGGSAVVLGDGDASSTVSGGVPPSGRSLSMHPTRVQADDAPPHIVRGESPHERNSAILPAPPPRVKDPRRMFHVKHLRRPDRASWRPRRCFT